MDIQNHAEKIFLPELIYDKPNDQAIELTAKQQTHLPPTEQVRRNERKDGDCKFQLLPGQRFSVDQAEYEAALTEEPDLQGGGLAQIIDGYDERLGRPVKIKIFRMDILQLKQFREAFFRQARILANIEHPNIVKVFGLTFLLFASRNTSFSFLKPALVMEDCGGVDLKKYYLEHQELPPDLNEIMRIGTNVADALDYLHAQGIVHLDVALNNIMLLSDRRVKLIDFDPCRGSYRPEEKAPDYPGMVKPGFSAPEVYVSTETEHLLQADQYSLAKCLYFLLGGDTLCYQNISDPRDVICDQVVPGFELINIPQLPDQANAILRKATSFKPEDRYQNCTEFVGVLAAALSNA